MLKAEQADKRNGMTESCADRLKAQYYTPLSVPPAQYRKFYKELKYGWNRADF